MYKCISKEVLKKICIVVLEILIADCFNKGKDYVKTRRKKAKKGES